MSRPVALSVELVLLAAIALAAVLVAQGPLLFAHPEVMTFAVANVNNPCQSS